mmetsp:Transcript_60910/g.176161  ORF Transcript_60910/g.176161 Transcript_60910/m.176161 type:complete len:92 (+) Transcript_60910:1671-1946(+)
MKALNLGHKNGVKERYTPPTMAAVLLPPLSTRRTFEVATAEDPTVNATDALHMSQSMDELGPCIPRMNDVRLDVMACDEPVPEQAPASLSM